LKEARTTLERILRDRDWPPLLCAALAEIEELRALVTTFLVTLDLPEPGFHAAITFGAATLIREKIVRLRKELRTRRTDHL